MYQPQHQSTRLRHKHHNRFAYFSCVLGLLALSAKPSLGGDYHVCVLSQICTYFHPFLISVGIQVKLVAPQPQGNERRCKFVSWEWMEEYEYSRPRSYWTTKNEMNNFHVDYRASAKLVSEFPDCANSEKPADKCAADEFCMKRVGADASDVVDSYLGEKRTPVSVECAIRLLQYFIHLSLTLFSNLLAIDTGIV